jgi:exonuclease SbcC
MFNKLLESTKGYLQTNDNSEEDYKKKLEEKDNFLKIKNNRINELIKENQALNKTILMKDEEIKRYKEDLQKANLSSNNINTLNDQIDKESDINIKISLFQDTLSKLNTSVTVIQNTLSKEVENIDNLIVNMQNKIKETNILINEVLKPKVLLAINEKIDETIFIKNFSSSVIDETKTEEEVKDDIKQTDNEILNNQDQLSKKKKRRNKKKNKNPLEEESQVDTISNQKEAEEDDNQNIQIINDKAYALNGFYFIINKTNEANKINDNLENLAISNNILIETDTKLNQVKSNLIHINNEVLQNIITHNDTTKEVREIFDSIIMSKSNQQNQNNIVEQKLLLLEKELIKANQEIQELIKISDKQKNKLFEYETHCKLKDDEFEKILEQNTELMEIKEDESSKHHALLNLFKQSLTIITSKLQCKNGENEHLDRVFSLYNDNNQAFKDSILSFTNDINNKIINNSIEIFLKENLKITYLNNKYQSDLNLINNLLQDSQNLNLDLLSKVISSFIKKLEANDKDKEQESSELNLKIKKLNLIYEDQIKEKEKLQDKLKLLKGENELLTAENNELINKIEDKNKLEKDYINKISQLNKVNENLSKSIKSFEENSENINQYQEINSELENDLKIIKRNFIEVEDILKITKINHENEIELLQNNISELTLLNKNNDELISTYFKELTELKSSKYVILTTEEKQLIDKKISDFEIENKHLREAKDKMKLYCDEILTKTKLEMIEKKYLIDKRIVSNHFLKYLDKNTDWRIKQSLIETLANIFDYNNDDRKKIGLSSIKEINKDIGNGGNNDNDKLQQLSDLLYNSIMND